MQYRYIEHATELEDRWPICGEGYPANPGSCDGDTDPDTGGSGSGTGEDHTPSVEVDATAPEEGDDKGGCACASASAPLGSPLLASLSLGLVVVARRRAS